MTIWALFLSIVPILYLMRRAMFNFYIMVNIEEWYRKHVFVSLINLSFMKIGFTSMLNFWYLRAYHWAELVFSAGMGGIGMCIVVFWSCFEAWSAILFYRDIKEWKRPPYHWKYVLFYDYSIMSPTCYFYQWQVNLWRLFFLFLLVIAEKTQYLSIGVLVFM